MHDSYSNKYIQTASKRQKYLQITTENFRLNDFWKNSKESIILIRKPF